MYYNFNKLFEGSARLGGILGIMNIPWPTVVPFIQAFSLHMNKYLEFSIGEKGDNLGIMTKGSGKEFAFKLAKLMETHGIDKERLKRFLVAAKYFDYRNIFFKIEIDKSGISEFSYYFRRRPSIEIAQAWLKSSNVRNEDLILVKEIATVLHKKTVHFLASSETPDGQSIQKIYFTQPIVSNSFNVIQQASFLAGNTSIDWIKLEEYKKLLVQNQLFVSLSFKKGKLIPGVKLDIQNVDQQTLWNMLTQKKGKNEIKKQFQLLLTLLEKKNVDYLGLHIRPVKPIKCKIYLHMSET